MRALALLGALVSLIVACRNDSSLDGEDGPDLKRPSPPDLAPPPAKCAAGKGLSGDNLICVDFAAIPDGPLGNSPLAQLKGWDFASKCGGNYWQVASGMLQLKNFATYADTCGLTLPPVNFNDADKQKYQSITLSIVQQVDLDLGTALPNQLEQLYFGTAVPAFLITQASGTLPQQQTTITLSKQKIPASMTNTVKYLLQVVSAMAENKQGLQISSVAVNLSQ